MPEPTTSTLIVSVPGVGVAFCANAGAPAINAAAPSPLAIAMKILFRSNLMEAPQ